MPDILMVEKSVADRIENTKDGRAEWTDVLNWWELKHAIMLEGLLEAQNKERELPEPPTPTFIKPRLSTPEVSFFYLRRSLLLSFVSCSIRCSLKLDRQTKNRPRCSCLTRSLP